MKLKCYVLLYTELKRKLVRFYFFSSSSLLEKTHSEEITKKNNPAFYILFCITSAQGKEFACSVHLFKHMLLILWLYCPWKEEAKILFFFFKLLSVKNVLIEFSYFLDCIILKSVPFTIWRLCRIIILSQEQPNCTNKLPFHGKWEDFCLQFNTVFWGGGGRGKSWSSSC